MGITTDRLIQMTRPRHALCLVLFSVKMNGDDDKDDGDDDDDDEDDGDDNDDDDDDDDGDVYDVDDDDLDDADDDSCGVLLCVWGNPIMMMMMLVVSVPV